MTDSAGGFREDLSARARAFIDTFSAEEALPLDSWVRAPDIASEWEGLAEARRIASVFDDSYRGISVLSLGGPLKGAVRLGVYGVRPVWRTEQGMIVFRCGIHPTIQCAVVTSVDGRLGCSWTSEFSPLFDSIQLYIENAAAWAVVQGWRYVAVGDVITSSVLSVFDELSVDPLVSGGLAAWWIAADHAMVTQQRLNPAIGGRPQISILARTPAAKEQARSRLVKTGIDPLAFQTADFIGRVPTLSPG